MHARAARQGSAKHEADKGREGQGGVQGDEDCFHSVDGGFGEKQAKPGLTDFSGVWAYIPKMGQGAAIIIATDNDTGGRKMAGQVAASADENGRADLQIVQDLPEGEGRDWNNVVRAVAHAK